MQPSTSAVLCCVGVSVGNAQQQHIHMVSTLEGCADCITGFEAPKASLHSNLELPHCVGVADP
jgi:hypothetical protein